MLSLGRSEAHRASAASRLMMGFAMLSPSYELTASADDHTSSSSSDNGPERRTSIIFSLGR